MKFEKVLPALRKGRIISFARGRGKEYYRMYRNKLQWLDRVTEEIYDVVVNSYYEWVNDNDGFNYRNIKIYDILNNDTWKVEVGLPKSYKVK